jgi:hypothetical protein
MQLHSNAATCPKQRLFIQTNGDWFQIVETLACTVYYSVPIWVRTRLKRGDLFR